MTPTTITPIKYINVQGKPIYYLHIINELGMHHLMTISQKTFEKMKMITGTSKETEQGQLYNKFSENTNKTNTGEQPTKNFEIWGK